MKREKCPTFKSIGLWPLDGVFSANHWNTNCESLNEIPYRNHIAGGENAIQRLF
jgi:hypothetical protein